MRYVSQEPSKVLVPKIDYGGISACRLGKGALEWKLCIVNARVKTIQLNDLP
jgi:hypothetical protein